MQTLFSFSVSDTQVFYRSDDAGHVELVLLPVGMPLVESETDYRNQVGPLAEVRLRGDAPTSSFGSGRTMRFGGSSDAFRFREQIVGDHRVETVLSDGVGHELRHILTWTGDSPVFVSTSEFSNHADTPVTLDAITSFSLSGVPGYESGEAEERIRIHRYRSNWSAEARPVNESLEDLGLERAWGWGQIRAERFGQVGTMPVRGFHPFLAVEDTATGVFWGAQLAWTGSWQMEVLRNRANGLFLDGGLADREFGHWSKTIAPGETFRTPEAFLACRKGTFDGLCQRLLEEQERRLNVPVCEEDLPIVYNEWCTSWGNPEEAGLLEAADRLKGSPVRYLVIDAGWYRDDSAANWASGQGDWIVNRRLFPDGLAATADRIRERGLIPGIWFEAEVAGCDSHAFQTETASHLTVEGRTLVVGSRQFLNLQNPEARRILDERVVHFLKDNHIGYVKIDYNETIGLGCDHPDSLGEGLRRQVEGTHWFFRRLREVNPDLVVENCSSGGHRLEPAMFALSSMSSFSDAHEEPEIPVIAAHLHNLMLPRQCQIWAVLHPESDDTRLRYLLGGGMLGRLCLSGHIGKLSAAQWTIVQEAMAFYQRIKGVIKHGESAIFPAMGASWRRLRGGLSLRRIGKDGKEAIAYFFAFHEVPETLRVPMPEEGWRIADSFGEGDTSMEGADVVFRPAAPMSCRVVHLVRQ